MHNASFLCRIMLCSVACLAVLTFLHIVSLRENFGEYFLNTKWVFGISVQIWSETLFIPITIQSHVAITVPTFACKLLALFS